MFYFYPSEPSYGRPRSYKCMCNAGTGCSPRQFACGGDTHDCVSDLMTCDGTADCANGADEDSKMCC